MAKARVLVKDRFNENHCAPGRFNSDLAFCAFGFLLEAREPAKHRRKNGDPIR
jgi:hypothetical protein